MLRRGVRRTEKSFMKNDIHNRKYLKLYRKDLRNNLTISEARLWKALQKKQLDGRKFRRQHSIEDFIVDFYCPAEKLAIELDGSVHDNMVNGTYDDERAERLNELGIKVLRFANQEIKDCLDQVLELIKQEIKD